RKRLIALIGGTTLALGAIVASTPHAVRAPIDLNAYALTVAARQTPPGVQRALVIRDSSAFDLAIRTHGVFDGGSLRGAAYGVSGCDVLRGRAIAAAGALPPRQPRCVQFFDDVEKLTRAYNPNFGVLMLGPLATRDRRIGANIVRLGSSQYRSLVVAA